jgi:hypothetical protein
MARCDVAVAYRIYPKVAESALGLPFSDDKLRLADICLKSFKESLGTLRVKVWALLDGCPPEYRHLFERYFDHDDLVIIELAGAGNSGTFLKQLETLLAQNDSELVYFAEDDYFYLPNQFHSMLAFMAAHEDAHFVSPFDHLDCYTTDLHHQPQWVRVHGGHHWRTVSSTCLTFLTKKTTLQRSHTVLRNYKRRSLDCSMWLSLTKQRVFNPAFFTRNLFRERLSSKFVLKAWVYFWPQILFGDIWNLWIPIPAIATHLDVNALSPNVDWRRLMEDASRRECVKESANTQHDGKGVGIADVVRK